MRTRKALVWNGGVEEREEPLPPLPRGWVLLRVEHAAWTGVEQAAALGLTLPRRGVVLGHTGAGRVVEAGVDAEGLSGSYLAATRLPEQGFPGVDVDGWLATYTAVPAVALSPAPPSLGWLSALSLPASLACDAANWLEDRGVGELLVQGSGLYSILLAFEAARRGIVVYSESVPESCGATRPRPGRPVAEAVASLLPVEPKARIVVRHPLSRMCLRGKGELLVYTPHRGAECWAPLLRRARACLEKLVGRLEAEEPVVPGESPLVFSFAARRRGTP